MHGTSNATLLYLNWTRKVLNFSLSKFPAILIILLLHLIFEAQFIYYIHFLKDVGRECTVLIPLSRM